MDSKSQRPKIKWLIFKRKGKSSLEGVSPVLRLSNVEEEVEVEEGITTTLTPEVHIISSDSVEFNTDPTILSDCSRYGENAFCIQVRSSALGKTQIYTIGAPGRPYEGDLYRRYVGLAFFTPVGSQCNMEVRLWTKTGDTSGPFDLKSIPLNRYSETLFPGEGFRIYGGWVGASFTRSSSSFDCPSTIEVVIGTGFY